MRAVTFGRERGLALITVLWVLTLLAVIAGSLTLTVRREVNAVRNNVDLARGRALAEAGIRYTFLQLKHPSADARWRPNGQWHRFRLGGVTVHARARQVSGRIDLNRAPPELLEGLLRAVGVQDESRRKTLAANIQDWRDDNNATRPGGTGERSTGAGDPGPYDRDFLDIAELQRVPGITPELYRRLAPNLTVFNGTPVITPWGANPTTLLALPGANQAMVDSYLKRVDRAYQQSAPLPPFPAGKRYLERFGTGAYAIAAWAELPGGLWVGRGAEVVDTVGRNRDPFILLSLRELDAGDAPRQAAQDG
ncbi:general secretion pathway protein GspK [Arhodomonas sp. AD133]|uniref:general secretion pathway protein GspK n=1 Tax=Arhodomonas sp. AD133 TaxID=3415009 RepID=UPI003EC08485